MKKTITITKEVQVELPISYHVHIGKMTMFADDIKAQVITMSSGKKFTSVDFYCGGRIIGYSDGKFKSEVSILENDIVYSLTALD